MKRGRIRTILAILTAVSILGGCAVPKGSAGDASDGGMVREQHGQGEEAVPQTGTEREDASGVQEEQGESDADQAPAQTVARPMLITRTGQQEEDPAAPCVEAYTVDPDLGNVDNLWQFYLTDEMTDLLAQNGFMVRDYEGKEFFEIYETNRYSQISNFVTVDSLMHTYHLYFSYLLKNIEKEHLAESVAQLSGRMLEHSLAQYDILKGSEWEEAALRNVAFFTVGAKLLDEDTQVNEDARELVLRELDAIDRTEWVEESVITGFQEDYTQYIPRGYYEGDEKLESYFKAMMWYGRTHFRQEDEDLDRSALLITWALLEDEQAYDLWEAVYAVTSFFAGASDDPGVCEYGPMIREVYGEDFSLEALVGDEEGFAKFRTLTSSVPAPVINSIPIGDGEDNVIPGFRFMGQRFTIDGAIMQQLIYQNVKENSAGERRMLPDVLDVPAALGSDLALRILQESGGTDYPGYLENMEKLRAGLSKENETLWSASLYAGWLHILRPLLIVKGEGYPMFMQGEQWAKKNLECFAGSFTELKHDTVLYSKQVIAEMGDGGYEEESDDRGYVEPEPLVYERFARLARQTAQGLEGYGMISEAAREDLMRLAEMADRLRAISEKELRDEVLTDEEYEFIRGYGGSIEHFWYEAVKDEGERDMITSQEFPAAVVVDIATDPNGRILEAATGNPSVLYVVVKVDGKVKLASGSVYSFYQFEWPLNDRLTDAKWCQMMGIAPDEEGYLSYDTSIDQPQWTQSYRFKWE